jgi:hypothetical protein
LGVVFNTATIPDLRSQLAEACRVEFQGCAELKEIIDSSMFTYDLTDQGGNKTEYQATFKILSSGVLDVNWTSARQIQENQTRNMINSTGGLAPTTLPNEFSPIINRTYLDDDNDDEVPKLLPNIY